MKPNWEAIRGENTAKYRDLHFRETEVEHFFVSADVGLDRRREHVEYSQ